MDLQSPATCFGIDQADNVLRIPLFPRDIRLGEKKKASLPTFVLTKAFKVFHIQTLRSIGHLDDQLELCHLSISPSQPTALISFLFFNSWVWVVWLSDDSEPPVPVQI